MTDNIHPFISLIREAINDRSFVDTNGDLHCCQGLTVDEIEYIFFDYERNHQHQPPTPFITMSSTDLITLSEKEWTNRAERKEPAYDKRSWISGWMDGYFSKPEVGLDENNK